MFGQFVKRIVQRIVQITAVVAGIHLDSDAVRIAQPLLEQRDGPLLIGLVQHVALHASTIGDAPGLAVADRIKRTGQIDRHRQALPLRRTAAPGPHRDRRLNAEPVEFGQQMFGAVDMPGFAGPLVETVEL